MSEPDTAKPDADADKRARERVDKLLARPVVLGSGKVTLASGRQVDYGIRAAFVPVTAGGFGNFRRADETPFNRIFETIP